MIVTDSGVHIWRAAGPDRPWQLGRKAHLETPIGYEDLSAMMVQAGVHRAILVPPSWEGDRIDYSLEAAARYPERFAFMGRIPVEKRVRDMREEPLAPAIEATITLAKHPNVFVKLTQIPECSSPPYPYKTTQPYVRRVIEAFGPRRSFWGTDLSAMLSRTACTYRQAVTLFTEEMKFLSADDIEWIMGRGIAECLPWPVQ